MLFAQRLFASAGLYHFNLDGDWGPQTQAAQDEFLERDAMVLANRIIEVDVFETNG